MQSANTFRLRRKALQAASAGFMAFAAFAATATPASAANIFEALFGVRRQPVYAPAPALPAAALPNANLERKKKPKPVRAEGPQVRRAAVRPPVLAGPVGQFLLDPTLRRGDVVVTNEGLKVFTGNGGSQHREGDFMALSRASQFAAGKSPVLAAIDKANRASAKPLVEVQAVPVQRTTPQPPVANAAAGKQASAAGTVR